MLCKSFYNNILQISYLNSAISREQKRLRQSICHSLEFLKENRISFYNTGISIAIVHRLSSSLMFASTIEFPIKV